MRTLRNSLLSPVAWTFLLFCPTPILGQVSHEPTDLEGRHARHFPEKPPALLELAEDADHRPLIIITNSHQFALTAYAVQTEPKSADDSPQTLIYDALTRMGGLLAPIPKGLSHKIGIPISWAGWCQTPNSSPPFGKMAALLARTTCSPEYPTAARRLPTAMIAQSPPCKPDWIRIGL